MRETNSSGGYPRRRRPPVLRVVLAIVVALGLGLGLGLFATAAGAAPVAPSFLPSSLMVSDGAAAKVSFYRVPGMTLTGTLTGVKLGSNGSSPPGANPAANTPMHGGAIVLPDSRILVNDESHQQTLAIKLNAAGVPSIVNSTSSRLGTEAPWTAVDSLFHYYAVASNGGGPPRSTWTR
jgi:hypothetical protein